MWIHKGMVGLADLLDGAFTTRSFSGSIPTGQYYANIEKPVDNVDGYTPVGMVLAGTSVATVFVVGSSIAGGTAKLTVSRGANGGVINAGLYNMTILYIKNELMGGGSTA